MIAGPVAYLLAAATIGVACFHAGRLVLAALWRRPTDVDVDVVHTAMGVSMAGMLTGWLTGAWNDVWVVAFVSASLWFGWGLVRGLSDSRSAGLAIAHHLPHFVVSAVMLYMLWAVRWTGMAGAHPGAAGSMGAMGIVGQAGAGGLLLPSVLAAFVIGNAAIAAWMAFSPSLGTAAVVRAAHSGTAPFATAVGPYASAARTRAAARPVGGVLGARVAPACLFAMSVTMAYMVVAVHP